MGTFQEQLVSFANIVVSRLEKCGNEEQTKLYLIIPFLRLLGYDAGDPSQVVAESSAQQIDQPLVTIFKTRVRELASSQVATLRGICITALAAAAALNAPFAHAESQSDP